MRVDYEYAFDPEEPNNTAASIYRMAVTGGKRVLDLGSGPGIVSSYLQTVDNREVTCLDSDEELLAVARERGVPETIVADLNQPGWDAGLEGRTFDVVILADVLEHLTDPGQVLSRIRESSLLSEDGYLVVSVPNAAHEGAIAELVSGQLTYRPTGLLDETHVRFFTLSSFRRMAESHGFMVTHVDRTLRKAEQTEFKHRVAEVAPELRRLVGESNPDTAVYQYVMRLGPTTEGEMLSSRLDEIDQLKQALFDSRETVQKLEKTSAAMEAELRALSADVEGARTSHRGAMRRLREAQIGRLLEVDRTRKRLEAELKDEKAERKRLAREVKALERKVEQIYASNTWRMGARIRRIVSVFRPGAGTSARSSTAALGAVEEEIEEKALAGKIVGDPSPVAEEYRAEIERAGVHGDATLMFAVSTTEFDEGRGDVYVAVGIGRHLRRLGRSSIYLPPNLWYDCPSEIDTVVAMLPSLMPSSLTAGPKVVGWVRNEIENWLAHPELGLFDAILCSSPLALAAIQERYTGPTELLPIGVDLDLFEMTESLGRNGVVATVNQWGRERDVYRALRATSFDFPLAIFGRDLGLADELREHHAGTVDFFALPDIYKRSVVVLDDFNHTTVGWGAVNSRVFEALACGALCITNSRLGLEDLGLEELPTYRDPAELNPLISSFLNDRVGTEALVSRLKDVVRERHSYQRRAEDLADFLGRLGASKSKILAFYPDYRENNPFQDMLYRDARAFDTVPVPLAGLDALGSFSSRYADRERLLHLHWTAPLIGPATSEVEALGLAHDVLATIDRFLDSGGRLAWTVHNVLPHECRYPNVEAHLRSELANRAAVVHVLCEQTPDATREHYELPRDRTRVVPHSSYLGIYPDAVSRDLARSRLGIEEGDIAILAFGGIRPYKGIDRLVDALDRALEEEPRLRLVVAGKPGRFEGIKPLQARLEGHPRCIPVFSEIPSEDLQYFYRAADVAVLAHRAVLNSGALLLAYSFAVPVIAPSVGCLKEALDPASSIAFDPDDEGSLVDALARSSELANHEARRAARSLAENRPVGAMSTAFLAALPTTVSH